MRLDELRADDSMPVSSMELVDEMSRQTSELAQDIHHLSHRLHSSTLDSLGLVDALDALCSEDQAHNPAKIVFVHSNVTASVPPEISLCLYRIAQEAPTASSTAGAAQGAKGRATSAAP